MSGAFGGRHSRRASDFPSPQSAPARQAYQDSVPASPPQGQLNSGFWNTTGGSPPPNASRVWPTAAPSPVIQVGPPVVKNPYNRKLTCTAENVILCLLDATGSMGSWRKEIWARVETLLVEAQQYLGQNLQIVFGVFGDLKCGDCIEVCDPAGDQPTLDKHLVALNLDMRGGGDGEESPEQMMYYLLQQVDTTACRNVFAFIITDEAAAKVLDPTLTQQHLGLSAEALATKEVWRRLLLKMEAYLVLRTTNCYDPGPIRRFWEDTTPERILPLDDGRRVVDVMLGQVAQKTGQLQKFSQNFSQRNVGSIHASQNLNTVMTSLSFTGSGLKQPPVVQPRPSRLLASVAKPGNDGDDD